MSIYNVVSLSLSRSLILSGLINHYNLGCTLSPCSLCFCTLNPTTHLFPFSTLISFSALAKNRGSQVSRPLPLEVTVMLQNFTKINIHVRERHG